MPTDNTDYEYDQTEAITQSLVDLGFDHTQAYEFAVEYVANRAAVLRALGAKLAGWNERLDGKPHDVWLIPKEDVTDGQ